MSAKLSAGAAALILSLIATLASAQNTRPLAHEDDMPRFCASVDRETQRYYPSRALEREQEGSVVLDCIVSDNAISSCQVVEDTNPGWDFGTAALRLACRFTVRSSADGPQLGAAPRDTSVTTNADGRIHAHIPIRFRLAPAAPPPPPHP